MSLREFEVELSAEVTVRDRRLAESAEQAEQFAARSVRDAIRGGLQRELSSGESTTDVTVDNVRDTTAGGDDA